MLFSCVFALAFPSLKRSVHWTFVHPHDVCLILYCQKANYFGCRIHTKYFKTNIDSGLPMIRKRKRHNTALAIQIKDLHKNKWRMVRFLAHATSLRHAVYMTYECRSVLKCPCDKKNHFFFSFRFWKCVCLTPDWQNFELWFLSKGRLLWV